MTGNELISTGNVLFIIAVIGFLSGMWYRIENAIAKARSESMLRAEAAAGIASMVQQQLAEHKLHVAETYITKAGMRETTDQIMTGVSAVKASVDQLNQRMDRVIENRHVPPKPRPHT